MKNYKVLFVTRKYPPIKGGMEAYSYGLITNYRWNKDTLILNKRQKHLVWFLPYAFIYVLFNAKKYDVIELGDMLLAAIGWIAKKVNKNIIVVSTVHGLDITYSRKIYRLYLKLFSYGFDMYVPNSKYTLSVASQKGYKPLKFIPPATLNGKKSLIKYDRSLFCEKYGIKSDSFIVATVGRLVKRKGVEWFISNVLKKYDNRDLVYFVIGEGEMRDDIEQAIKNIGDTRVKLLGRISDKELDELYANINVFLMPNIYVENDVEGFGMVAVEAAASEAIVVASNIQGITDAVKDGKNGILYEAENSDQLIEILDDIYLNPDKFLELKKQARHYVISEFTGEAVANKYREIFDDLVYNK